ncbi:MAG: NFACT family protein [Chloroflexota bacterium]|nr:NFACT family protein [Chloroflexota bacterium]
MPFDALAMAAVTDDLCTAMVGGRIQRIIQPSAAALAFAVYSQGTQTWLLLSADTRFARVQVAEERLAKAFATPSMFVMLLRKHLEGARILDPEQPPQERVLRLPCQAGPITLTLVVEVMGKHSNIVLVGEDGAILGAVKLVPHRLSRVRPILVGLRYEPPPPQPRNEALYPPGPRVDPMVAPEQWRALLETIAADVSPSTALQGLLPGASPFLVEQILRKAGSTGGQSVQEVGISNLLASANHFYQMYQARNWRPSVFTDSRGRWDFAPYEPLGMDHVLCCTTMSQAIERCLGQTESRDSLGSARKVVLDQVNRAVEIVRRRVESMREGMAATAQAEIVMQQGQLVQAYQHAVQEGSSKLVIPELDVTIALDPLLSPNENAERLFRRYRKLRDARKKLPELLKRAETEAARLSDLAAFGLLAESEADLRAVRDQVSTEPARPLTAKARPGKKRGPAQFSCSGVTALVGRNARENEEVTFHLARRDDLWLHVRERTGAHVILQGGADLSDEVVAAAASLAAYFSEGRLDSAVDVDVAPVRAVRKVPGGAPGRVTYRDFRTIRVSPTTEGWASSSGR